MDTNKAKRRTDAERIAFMLGWDIADVRDTRYQYGHTPSGFQWTVLATLGAMYRNREEF